MLSITVGTIFPVIGGAALCADERLIVINKKLGEVTLSTDYWDSREGGGEINHTHLSLHKNRNARPMVSPRSASIRLLGPLSLLYHKKKSARHLPVG